MVNEQLLTFIRESRKAGTSDEQTRQSLLSSGWHAQDIQEAFTLLDSQSFGGTMNIYALSKKHLKLITTVVVIGIAVGGYFVSAQFDLLPNLGKIKEIVLSDKSLNNVSTKNEKVPSSETTKIGVSSGIEKFYYAVIEKGGLVYPAGQGSYNYAIPNIVTIYKYDIDEAKLSKAFGPYPSGANYLEADYAPRSIVSESGNTVIFSDSALYTFLGGTKEFKIITPHNDLVTENVESPVLSPDGNKIAYSVGSQIKMFDKTAGEYKVLIKDTAQLFHGSQNFHGSSVYPVFWYTKDGDDRLLVEVRSKNQNSIPLALTGFYIYSFSSNKYTPVSFYYAPGKKIQQCSGYDWSCEQSPIVRSRSPNGHYELIEEGDSGISIINYSVLATTQPENLESATKSLPTCPFYNGNTVWSYDSKKLLCSGLDISFDEQFSNLAITNLKNDKPFDLTYKYATIDIQSGVVINSSEEKLRVMIPQKTRDEFLNQLQKLDDQLAKKGIKKGSKEYDAYMGQSSWGLFLILQSSAAEQAKNVIGWVGMDTYLAIKTKSDEQRDNPISQEIILTDLKGNDKTLETYFANPSDKLEGQSLIDKLKSANVNKEALSGLEKDIAEGKNFFATIDEIYIKYLGGVSP
jgi:hypothetical protein